MEQQKYFSLIKGKYVEGMLSRFEMQDCKSVLIPLERGTTFHKRTENEESFDRHICQQATG